MLVVVVVDKKKICYDYSDEAAVLAQLEGIVSLLVPGFSVLQLWNEHGQQMGQAPGKVRDAVILVLSALDRHCPDVEASVTDHPGSTSPTSI